MIAEAKGRKEGKDKPESSNKNRHVKVQIFKDK